MSDGVLLAINKLLSPLDMQNILKFCTVVYIIYVPCSNMIFALLFHVITVSVPNWYSLWYQKGQNEDHNVSTHCISLKSLASVMKNDIMAFPCLCDWMEGCVSCVQFTSTLHALVLNKMVHGIHDCEQGSKPQENVIELAVFRDRWKKAKQKQSPEDWSPKKEHIVIYDTFE